MTDTVPQELRRLRRILAHFEKLSPAGRRWLLDYLADLPEGPK